MQHLLRTSGAFSGSELEAQKDFVAVRDARQSGAAYERDEDARSRMLPVHFAVCGFLAYQKLLAIVVTDGNREPPARTKLGDQLVRHVFGPRGDQDAIVRGERGQTLAAVSFEHLDVFVSKIGETLPRPVSQLRHDLDRVNGSRQLAEERCCVTGAGSHLEHAIRGCWLQRREHDRDHAGLTDGLTVPHGERRILISARELRVRNEYVSGNARERGEQPRVRDARLPRNGVHQLLPRFVAERCVGALDFDRFHVRAGHARNVRPCSRFGNGLPSRSS